MGTTQIRDIVTGATLKGAFNEAVNAAMDEYGDEGYTGTIAEKDSVHLFAEPPRTPNEAEARATELWHHEELDKWGPAGALPLHPIDGANAWLIFGDVSC